MNKHITNTSLKNNNIIFTIIFYISKKNVLIILDKRFDNNKIYIISFNFFIF